jgi:hypothetical protein
MINKKLLFLNAFKLGLCFNVFTFVLAIIYIFAVENLLTHPFNFQPTIQLGTIVTGEKIFGSTNISSYKVLPNWSLVKSKFSLFVTETQFRADWKQPAPRLEHWCKSNNCCVHRIGHDDKRKMNFKCFTIDDWFITNRRLFGSHLENTVTLVLDKFLKSLPAGSRIILNEPSDLFTNRLTFDAYEKWVLGLVVKHPQLKFEIGIQIHLQWVDSFWIYNNWVFPRLNKFFQQHHIPWGISEFSIYDRVWKRRLSPSSRNHNKFLFQIESMIPDRLRHAVVLHQAYLVHYDATRYNAQFVVEWGNFPTIWFSNEIDSDYKSTFALFDWSGQPLPMYWAIARGISDGKK